MRAVLLCAGAMALAVSLGSVASAQDVPDTVYAFDDDDVVGDYQSPLIGCVLANHRGPRRTVVRPRLHFVPELVKSVETL
ncbi:MAG: hypothetical protein H6719_10685 [Sandaracinaceae bacterium]|nr:hypothetical protein [Sandaracinaceae bacterium]